MTRFLLIVSTIFLMACQPRPQAEINLPSADETAGLNAPAPIPTTASTQPPTPREAGQPIPGQMQNRGVDGPATYGSTAVMSPQSYAGLSEDQIALVQMMGSWVNTTDTDETLSFDNDSYTVYYEGELVIEEPVTYLTNCSADCTGGAPADYPCFVVSSAYGTDCFAVVRLTASEMELSLLGESTTTVLYRKM